MKCDETAGYDFRVLDRLKSHFEYDQFLPLQEEVISWVMDGKDALAVMPTGGGKSLCYQLPAVCVPGLTLVISPLIALMKDQVDALQANGIAAAFLNSTLTASEIAGVERQAKAGNLKLLYASPERLALPAFRNLLHGLDLQLIAVDEAHCISEWGHEFRPDYRNLKILRREFPKVPVIALTATATERVRRDIVSQLELKNSRTFIGSFNRSNLTYRVKAKKNSFAALLTLLRQHQNEPAIVYCFSRKSTEDLAAGLTARGVKALPYHAGLDSSIRKGTQDEFMRGDAAVVVATIAFGMGINKPDIRLVVHYDLPKSLEGYYQETGRAGRDGLPSECVLFYSYGDKVKQDFFIDQISDESERENARQKLGHIISLADLQSCRRRFLLEYFGQVWDQDNCCGCDICLDPKEEFDATDISQKILSAVIRTGEFFGAAHVIDVMVGADTQRVRARGHDQLSVYGVAQNHSKGELRQVINSLLARGLLAKNGTKLPTLGVTQVGRSFLKCRESLTLTRTAPTHAETNARNRRGARPRNARGSTIHETMQLLQEGLNVSEIAARRDLAHITIRGHLEQLILAGEQIDITNLLPPPERFARIQNALHQSADLKLAPVREYLGGDYSYDEIALVRMAMRQSGLLK